MSKEISIFVTHNQSVASNTCYHSQSKTNIMNGYNIFLMVEFARLHGIIDPQLEYDLTWEQGQKLYAEFEQSAFNVPSLDLGECFMQFIQSKESKFLPLTATQELIDQTLVEIQKDVNCGDLTAIEGMLQLVSAQLLKDYLPEK